MQLKYWCVECGASLPYGDEACPECGSIAIEEVVDYSDDPEFDSLKEPCDMCGKEYVGTSYIEDGHIHCAECHMIWNS